jgi:tetratricopeptide (TPR) repeat protein
MSVLPTSALADAVAHHQRGELSQAAQLYQQIVSHDPTNAEALHLLGVACLQGGQPRQAVDWLERVVHLQPNASAFHANLGEAYRALGQLGRAAVCYQLALRLRPDNADAAYNFGSVLMQQGRLAEAAALFRQALLHRPNFELAHNNLANACRMLGEIEQALKHFRRAIELNPRLGLAHGNLGQLLLECQRPQEALKHCQEAVQLDPQSAAARNNLGNVLRRLGRLNDAKVCYLEALRLEPSLAMVHNNLGEILLGQGKVDEARPWIMQAVQLQPSSALFQLRLATLQLETHDLTGAETHALNALRLEPNNAEVHLLLARVRLEQGRLDEVEKAYRAVLQARPNDPAINCRLADVLLELNQPEQALICVQTALRVDPNCSTALALLATQMRQHLTSEHEATMRRLLSEANLPVLDRAALEFGLGHLCDARRDYGQAAQHLLEANRIEGALRQQAGRAFNAEAHSNFVNRLLTVFSPEFFERVRGFGLDNECPVFIVGLPRSGTTLLEQVLASHSQVFGAGELRFAREDFETLGGGADGASEARAFDILKTINAETVQRLGRNHLERLAALNGKAARMIDKMPDNYLYVGFMHLLFPRARFLHCCRDLRDVAVSCWLTHFRDIPWSNDFEQMAARFTQYRRVMTHWRTVLPVPVLDVAYEDMVADLEGVARRVTTFLGLEWEPACLEFHRNRRPVRTASLAQVRQPIYRSSVGRWRHYEKSLQPLFDRLEQAEPGP